MLIRNDWWNLVEILQNKESETRFYCGQVNIDGTPHQPVDSVWAWCFIHTQITTQVCFMCSWSFQVFLFSKNLNASLFFIRIVWESLKSSTSLSLWQSFNTPGWSVTSRWVNMKLQSEVFLHALCCWMSNTAGWREGTITAGLVQLHKNVSQAFYRMFSSSCVGPGQHPACGCGLQH